MGVFSCIYEIFFVPLHPQRFLSMRHQFLSLIVVLLLPLTLRAENASNVRVLQRNKDIVITYDLAKSSYVQVFVASDKIPDFVPLQAVEGAVGERVKAGNNKEIIWHPLQESDNFIANNVRFKVEAMSSYDYYLLPKSHNNKRLGGKTNMETFITADVTYSFAKDLTYGLMLGQTYSGIGWYVDAHSNFNFASTTEGLVCGKGGEIEGVIPFYSGRKQSSAFVANAGLVLDILDLANACPKNRLNTFGFYVGAGYGWRRVLWETVDGKWIEYGPVSVSGMSVNGGLMGSIYGFTIKVGANVIGFKHLELEAGIGWMF